MDSHATKQAWQSVLTAPYDCDLELAVIDRKGEHALMFACRRTEGGWINATTKRRVEVQPTHWRDWCER